MKIFDRDHALFSKVSAILIAISLFGLIYAVTSSILLPFALSPVLVYVIYRLMMIKSFRRLTVSHKPFPQSWRDILDHNVAFFRQLSDTEKIRFEQLVSVFLAEQRIVGVDPVVIDDEIKLMVAAGAITLVFYRPEWEFRHFRDILIYEDAFDPDSYETAHDKSFLGMVGTQMPIILSRKHLQSGFRHGGDGFNVAYHEFAHIVDLHDVGTQSNPLHGIFAQALIQTEMKKIQRGQSVLRPYGAHNESEFFAVATEFFFERPAILYAHHRDLYHALRTIYNYDPLLQQTHD